MSSAAHADIHPSNETPAVPPAAPAGWRRRGPAGAADGRTRLIIGAVLAGYLVLQLAFMAGRHAVPFSDMTGYDERALLLLHQHTFQTGTAYGATYHGPGYILFLAAIYGVAGHHWEAVYAVQSVLATLTLLGIYLLARRLFSARAAFISLALGLLYLPFLAYAHVLMPDTLFIAPLVFSTLAFAVGVSNGSRRWLTASGILCAFAALTRSEALLLPVVFFLWIGLSRERWHVFRRLRSGLILFVVAMALALAPWTIHNYLDQKEFIPGDTVGGLNLLIGNHAGADGTFDEAPVWSNPAVQKALSEGKREAALDDVLRGQALAWSTAHPAGFLRLTGWRMLLFLGAPKDWLVDGMGSNTLGALSGFRDYYGWALMFFALVGGVAGLRRRRETLLPFLCFVYFLAVVSVFYFQTRYRLPAMPFVIMMAAYGLSAFSGRLRPRVKRRPSANPAPEACPPRAG